MTKETFQFCKHSRLFDSFIKESVFDEKVKNLEIFEKIGKPLVETVFKGINGNFFIDNVVIY